MFSSQTVMANGGLNPRRGRRAGISRAAMILSDLIHAVRHHVRCQRDYRYLQSLPDYLLDDIGLTRSQVETTTRRRLI